MNSLPCTLRLPLATVCLVLVVAACGDPAIDSPSQELETALSESDPQAYSSIDDKVDAHWASAASAEYVGSENCIDCHQQVVAQWQGSHHDLAMQVASTETVLGTFDGQTVEHLGERFTFSQRDGRYFVRTTNKEGQLHTFEISHTFGVTPLQQYLVALDNGAYQALSMAWDSRSKSAGGQRWYHLYPDEPMPFTDPLHWTRLHQNWNFQCADCHSTNLRKQYDAATNSYNTVFDEINVACEACHGPASNHLEWAGSPSSAEVAHSGFAATLSQSQVQIDTCAGCHSRRRVIQEGFEPGKPLYDHYVPALLEEGLYHADGQINDEVYVYGSFKQSKMFQAGVTCTNCHNPHTATLRLEGNAVCTQCHTDNPPAAYSGLLAKNYDSPEHHFHAEQSAGAQCRNCHMPAKTYMGVDERYDHSFRVPRPQQSQLIGAPDVCTACHEGRSATWASEAITKHLGQLVNPVSDLGSVFHQARNGLPVNEVLQSISSNSALTAIARASALIHMNYNLDSIALQEAQKQLGSAEPTIQLAALRLMENIPISERWTLVSPLLSDKHLAVRVEAARVLADAPSQFLQVDEKKKFELALNEFRQTQLLNADRPDALSNLASVAMRQGQVGEAEDFYRQAIAIDPSWIPAYLNLADLYRTGDRDDESETLFTAALEQAADIAEVHHAYGLWLSRQGRGEESLHELELAARLSNAWRYRYVYAIGLNSTGKAVLAEKELKEALNQSPNNPEILFALATILRDQNRYQDALHYALQLGSAHPGDPRVKGLIRQLRGMQMNAEMDSKSDL